MTDGEKTKMLKTLCEGESDEILSVYLTIAKNEILTRLYPCKSDVSEIEFPSKYDTLQVQIAQYLVNKQTKKN